MLWEYLKCEIQSKTIYSGQRARENALIEKSLKDPLEILEKKSTGFQYTEYLQLKGEWELIKQQNNNGIYI